MPQRYGEHSPTCFDKHLDIQWEPSEELSNLYDKQEHLNARIDNLEYDEYAAAAELRKRELAEIEAKIKELEAVEDRNNWLLAPVSRNRDSGPLDDSNFETALEILGGESGTVEVHRFGHWGPGWYEIILVHPSREKEVEDLESSLESYLVLDDEDLSRREYEAMEEDWDYWASRDFEKELLSCLESMANEEPAESDIERELREERELDEFMPDGGMTWRMAGQKPPTMSERLWQRIEEIENWSSEQLRQFAFEDCGLSWETLNDGTRFNTDEAITVAINDELFWDDPVVTQEKETSENV